MTATTIERPNPDTLAERDAILTALAAWIKQRPGLEYGNYASLGDTGAGRRAYFSEMRHITRQRHDADALLSAVWQRPRIDGPALREAFRAYTGRLTWTPTPKGGGTLSYVTGQYWPTEYRAATCAVLALALWDRWRADAEKAALAEGETIRDLIEAAGQRALPRGVFRRWIEDA